jgi:hypothetical protein
MQYGTNQTSGRNNHNTVSEHVARDVAARDRGPRDTVNGAHTIFRAEARRQAPPTDQVVVLPTLVSRPVFAVLWFAALGLAVVGGLVAFWPLLSTYLP